MSTLTTGQKVLVVLCILQGIIWLVPFALTIPLVIWAACEQEKANKAKLALGSYEPNWPYRVEPGKVAA